jgi:hypothetical protein
MRRLVPRTSRLIAFVAAILAAVVLVAACSCDSDSKRTTRSRQTTTASTEASTSTSAANDPAACLRGTFRFTQMDYDGPVQTAYGPTTIVGGIGGRRIELRPDNTFLFTDTGEDPVQFSVPVGGGTTSGTAVLKVEADGTYVPTASTSSFNITALRGSLTLRFPNGSNVDIPLPPDGAGVKETFGLNGDAQYSCDGPRVTARFAALTIGLERV